MAPKRWIPLESNPEVLTKFGHALGLSPALSFCDVWSLDLLDMVPSPRYAIILLFPLTDKILAAEAKTAAQQEPDLSKQPFFCKQTIGNACGTIAVLHAALNTAGDAFPLQDDSFFQKFLQKSKDMNPSERAAALQDDETLDSVHEEFAQQGQTSAPNADEKVDVHFICFVEHEGALYELDGRKDIPINHGSTTPASVLQDSATVIKDKFMALDPAENRFTILALTRRCHRCKSLLTSVLTICVPTLLQRQPESCAATPLVWFIRVWNWIVLALCKSTESSSQPDL